MEDNEFESNFKLLFLEYCIISFIIIIYLVIIRLVRPALIPPDPFFSVVSDHYYYRLMAENPINSLNGLIPDPFCYRILTPILAWLLPFELSINFQIVTYISLFLTGIFLYHILKLRFDRILAITGITLFYCFQYVTPYLFYNFWLPDALSYLFIVLCFFAIEKSNIRLFSSFLCIGVLVKETVLFTIITFLIKELLELEIKNPFKKEYLRKAIIPILPGLLILGICKYQ
ncbi:MAG: hypothetical protein ACFFC3_06790 [Candidatus Odinarchaeota archaeon]